MKGANTNICQCGSMRPFFVGRFINTIMGTDGTTDGGTDISYLILIDHS